MRKVILLLFLISIINFGNLISSADIVSQFGESSAPYKLAHNNPELLDQYQYWLFAIDRCYGFNNLTDIYEVYNGTKALFAAKIGLVLWYQSPENYDFLNTLHTFTIKNDPGWISITHSNFNLTHNSTGAYLVGDIFYLNPFAGYSTYFTTSSDNQVLSYKNNTTNSLTIELWSNGQSNVSINSPSRWTGTQDIGSSKIPFKIEPNETFIVKRNSGDLINIGVKEYNGESYVYDENSTINILSPNDNSKTVNPNEYITYRVKYSKFYLGTKVLMRRNDGIAVEPIAAVEIADNSTFTEFDKTYRLAIRLVANQNNKVEIFTRSLFNKVTGIKAVNIVHKTFVDTNQDGLDDESNQIQYGGSSVPLTEEPLNWADAAFNHGDYSMGEDGIPDVSAIAGKLVASTGQLSYLVTSLFTFLPPDLIAIIVFGIGLAILLRIVGR